MGFDNPIVGGTALRIPAIQSPNFQAGSAGWIIRIDGSAEFNNLTVRGTFNGTNFILNASGFFIYSGTPASGNLIASIASAAGTDSFGNTYLEGIVTYSGASFAALDAGNLFLGIIANGYPTAGAVSLSGADGVFLSSPTSVSNTASATAALVDGLTSVTPQSAAGYPHFDVGASTAGVTGWINGAWVHSTVNGGVSTAETWHTPTFSGSWVTTGTLNGNSTFQGMQYRMDAEDNVWISGGATTTAAGGSIFTLPSGYFNSSRRHLVPCWIFDSSAAATVTSFAQVTETGVVNIAASLTGVTIATGDQVYINGKFPLGNVG